MDNDGPDMDWKFEDLEPAEVRREAPETTEPYGPREALSTPPMPASGGSTALRYLLLGAIPLRWSWTFWTAAQMIADARTPNRLKIVAA